MPSSKKPGDSRLGPKPKPAAKPRVVGSYRLGRVLSEREMLATYEAEGTTVPRTAIVRSTAPSIAPTDRLKKRLLREAELVTRAAGDGVALVLEVDADGTFYAVEDPAGPSLADILARIAETAKEPGASTADIPAAAAMSLVSAMVTAVATVHEAGVVHASIEPGAFFLSAKKRVILFGFDRALLADAPVQRDAEPELERAASSTAYASPEQLLGEQPTFARDVFSLGVVAYELLARVHPFASSDPTEGKKRGDVAHRIRTERARAIPASRGVPIDLERLIQRALGKQPGHRPKSAIELAAELATITLPDSAEAERQAWFAKLGLRGKAAVVTADPAALPTVEPQSSLRPLAARLGGLLAVMLAIGAAIQWAERSDGDAPRSGRSGDAHGYVRVLAHPWAEVWIDGALVDTTPVGSPIELTNGRHTLVFKHPRAPEEKRVIDVKPGATSTLDVTLRVDRPPVDAGVDASP